MFGLDERRSIWVEKKDLGKFIVLEHNHKRYEVKIPLMINNKVILRLRGLGKTKDNKTGDLLLHIRLNKGVDYTRVLWLSETSAATGDKKILSFEGRKIQITIPPKSRNGLVILLKGLGRKSSFQWHNPFFHRKRGDLLVKLIVYPDTISPKYGSFETLSTDNMALEGWVYRKKDEIINRMGESFLNIDPIKAEVVADLFNEYGWVGIYRTLVGHLKLSNQNIKTKISNTISLPGNCQKYVTMQNNTPVTSNYVITINEQFTDNPFSVAAILAHELCHVVYSETIESKPNRIAYGMNEVNKDSKEEERIIDLLVFMFKIGEFQLRVSRDKRLVLGYFNQDIFERIQVIVSRK